MIQENKRRRNNTQGTKDVIDLMRKLKSRDQLLPFRVYLTRATSPSSFQTTISCSTLQVVSAVLP